MNGTDVPGDVGDTGRRATRRRIVVGGFRTRRERCQEDLRSMRSALGECERVRHFGAVETNTDDEWQWVLEVNVIGPLRVMASQTDGAKKGSGRDEIEAISQLKARYFWLMDTKDWDQTRDLFAPDVSVDVNGDGAGTFDGVESFMSMLEPTLRNVVTVHHGHMPEIALVSPTTATGIWAMEEN